MMDTASKKQLDMLHGPIWNKIPQFALPVAATAILEQLFNASDIAVVGNFTGAGRTIAVAAVGGNSPLIGLIVNLSDAKPRRSQAVCAEDAADPSVLQRSAASRQKECRAALAEDNQEHPRNSA